MSVTFFESLFSPSKRRLCPLHFLAAQIAHPLSIRAPAFEFPLYSSRIRAFIAVPAIDFPPTLQGFNVILHHLMVLLSG